MEEVHFKKGAEVEVSSDDDGFRGAWFAATVVRSPSRRTNKLLVQYKSLVTDRSRSKPLIEAVRTGQVRPLPPSEPIPVFSSGEKVDAFLNDGWWEGIVDKVLDDSRYSVFFSVTNEYMEFNQSELRIHREWVSGSWILPSEQEVWSFLFLPFGYYCFPLLLYQFFLSIFCLVAEISNQESSFYLFLVYFS